MITMRNCQTVGCYKNSKLSAKFLLKCVQWSCDNSNSVERTRTLSNKTSSLKKSLRNKKKLKDWRMIKLRLCIIKQWMWQWKCSCSASKWSEASAFALYRRITTPWSKFLEFRNVIKTEFAFSAKNKSATFRQLPQHRLVDGNVNCACSVVK